jgi:hypothetical protein
MTDLSTTNLKRLLDQATPGPWRISLTEGISGLGFAEDFYQDDPREKANVNLAELAPDLAQENLRMREALHDLSEVWEAVSIDPTRTPAEQHLAAQVVEHIKEALGDHDD